VAPLTPPEVPVQDSSHKNEAVRASAKGNGNNQPKGHGRKPVQAYTGANVEKITHALYQLGDPCPLQCGGNLYLTGWPIYPHSRGHPC